VIESGSTARVAPTAKLGAGTSTFREATAGKWMQQAGTTVLTGAVFGGQQPWFCVFGAVE